MKVLLLKDMPLMGNKGQIKDVKEGYALNYMIPNKLAVLADDVTLKNFKTAVQAKKDKEAVYEELTKDVLSSLKGKTVSIKTKASEKGKLFKSIHGKDIVNALKENHNIKIDESWIPTVSIKEVGESSLIIKKSGITAEIKIEVLAE
jgi:large subunit ribosomal protein L9